MVALYNLLESIRGFIELGGNVLWAILVVLLAMWTLILERYWYLLRVFPNERRGMIREWEGRSDRRSWHARRIRDGLISDARQKLRKNVGMIQTLVSICPLLGLLGTVTGMVAVFDVMAFFGTANARAMAAGVSKATVPTMAGMVAALSGVYFASHLDRKAALETEKIKDFLSSQ